MLDSRDELSYKDTMDPQACNLPETSNWKELSRDPLSKSKFSKKKEKIKNPNYAVSFAFNHIL